jgi:hypothetical protein
MLILLCIFLLHRIKNNYSMFRISSHGVVGSFRPPFCLNLL